MSTEERKKKKQARIRVMQILDIHCKDCEHYEKRNTDEYKTYCATCSFDQEIETLKSLLYKPVIMGRPPREGNKTDEEWTGICKEALARYEQGQTVPNITRALSVSSGSLYKELRKREMKFERKALPKGVPRTIKPEMIRQLKKQGLTHEEISERLGRAQEYIHFLIQSWKKRGIWEVENRSTPTKEELHELYSQGKSHNQIAEILGWSRGTISILLKRYGIKES